MHASAVRPAAEYLLKQQQRHPHPARVTSVHESCTGTVDCEMYAIAGQKGAAGQALPRACSVRCTFLARSVNLYEFHERSQPITIFLLRHGGLNFPASSRKTLIYLILTLNHIYPDYDFSQLRAHHFRKEAGLARAEELVDTHLLEVSKVWENTPGFGEAPFLDTLWSAIDEAIDLKDCDVYSYKSDGETDPFGEKATVWAFNFFFYNKKMKRILYLAVKAVSKAAADEDKDDEEDSKYAYNSDDEGEPDYGMANEMDI
eukprot:GHRQ01001734.1.p1 GENE.GHRQ01001734.1~~GHRQ01001734.1.p1  ORF type:complete len:259 (+),score=88.55 GHRQ01001734.1:550-1326(+)